MIKITTQSLQRAIERAKQIRPHVKIINPGERVYSVTGSRGDTYTVRFATPRDLKLASCDCPAGQHGMACYHVAAAAQANIMVQSMRLQGAVAPCAPLLSFI